MKILKSTTTVDIPALGVRSIPARVDTGARTSTLHGTVQDVVDREGKKTLRYSVLGSETVYEAEKFRRVFIRSSNGLREKRYIIPLEVTIDGVSRVIEVGLTDRSSMRYPFLVGRTALAGKFLVDVVDEVKNTPRE